jgi:hypothetical protein
MFYWVGVCFRCREPGKRIADFKIIDRKVLANPKEYLKEDAPLL